MNCLLGGLSNELLDQDQIGQVLSEDVFNFLIGDTGVVCGRLGRIGGLLDLVGARVIIMVSEVKFGTEKTEHTRSFATAVIAWTQRFSLHNLLADLLDDAL